MATAATLDPSTGGPRGKLYLVPNLLGLVPPADILPARTLAVARALRHFVVETAKPARQFLGSLDLPVPLQTVGIEVVPERPAAEDGTRLLLPALHGLDVGLLSDAGCPGVADPGAAIVAAAHRLGIAVVPLVGPSSILLGLMASGMNGQTFCFHGYLPVVQDARANALRRLDDEIERAGATQVFIETPYRNDVMLAAILAHCRPHRQVCIAADLTLQTEWIRSTSVASWRKHPSAPVGKRPALFLLGRPAV